MELPDDTVTESDGNGEEGNESEDDEYDSEVEAGDGAHVDRARRRKKKATSRKLWQQEEDDAIVKLVAAYGTKRWTYVAQRLKD